MIESEPPYYRWEFRITRRYADEMQAYARQQGISVTETVRRYFSLALYRRLNFVEGYKLLVGRVWLKRAYSYCLRLFGRTPGLRELSYPVAVEAEGERVKWTLNLNVPSDHFLQGLMSQLETQEPGVALDWIVAQAGPLLRAFTDGRLVMRYDGERRYSQIVMPV